MFLIRGLTLYAKCKSDGCGAVLNDAIAKGDATGTRICTGGAW